MCVCICLTLQKCRPLTLFPLLLTGGLKRHNPITFGTTSRITPETPDLAGRPTWVERGGEGGIKGQREGRGG